jgi:hypothetical protein
MRKTSAIHAASFYTTSKHDSLTLPFPTSSGGLQIHAHPTLDTPLGLGGFEKLFLLFPTLKIEHDYGY